MRDANRESKTRGGRTVESENMGKKRGKGMRFETKIEASTSKNPTICEPRRQMTDLAESTKGEDRGRWGQNHSGATPDAQ